MNRTGSADKCEEIGGEFWLFTTDYNSRDGWPTQVNYCPFCGAAAPKPSTQQPVPVEPRVEVDVDGQCDSRRSMILMGKAVKMSNGKWWCLAIGSFGLARVEVSIPEQPMPALWEGDQA